MDRLLQPDMSLQNNMQTKQFRISGAATTKQARTKEFYVTQRPAEKTFTPPKQYHAPTFDLRKIHFGTRKATLATQTVIPKTDVPYATPRYAGAKSAKLVDKVDDHVEYSESSRAFLVQGKSQKSLSAKNRPMTIDQVRELLNKNK